MGSAVWDMGFICSKVVLVGAFYHFKALRDEGSGSRHLPTAGLACWSYVIQSIPKGKIKGLCGPAQLIHVMLGAALHCLSDQAAPPADSHKPRRLQQTSPAALLFLFHFHKGKTPRED